MKEELYDLIYRSVFTAVTALFIFFEIFNYTDPGAVSHGNIFFVIVISISCNALLLLYRKVRFYMFPALFAVGLIFWLVTDKEDLENIAGSIALSLLIIGIAAFVIFLLCDRVVILGIIVAAGIFVFMVTELLLGYEVYPASPVLAAFFALAVLTKFLRDGLRPADPTRTRRYVTFLFPFLLLYLVLLLALPKSDKPVSWDWVQRMYENASQKINRLIHRLTTSYGVIDAGHFKISFDMDDSLDHDHYGAYQDELFEVIPNGDIIGSLYLKGEIFNEFRNGAWQNTLDTDVDYTMKDAAETSAGVAAYGEIPGNALLREASVRIRFLDIVSPIVFTPAKPLKLLALSADRKTTAVNEHLLFDDNLSYGSEYMVSFLQMNIGNKVFTEYMNAPAGDLLNNDKYRDYRVYVDQYYTSTPVFRDSVVNWIDAVTADAGSDYEKLLAVEKALSGFTYNSATEKLPSYVKSEGDFVDHFILEKREGYCVHYATAFCLIARYMGFPARVIKGFKAEVKANTATVITDACGHSWPEVYFAGKGWIPFEPTPGFGGERYDSWAVKSGKNETGRVEVNDKPKPDIPLPEEDPEYVEAHRERNVSWILILVIAGVVLFSIIILVVVRILLRHGKMKRMSAGEKYYHEFGMVLKTLAELGMRRAPGETLAEFAERCGITPVARCTAFHEECIYGGRIPAEENTALLSECRGELDMMMKEKFGRRYILHRLKLLIEE